MRKLFTRMLYPSGPNAGRLAPVQGIRGFAMSLVFFFHYTGLFAESARANGPGLAFMDAAARAGTDLFLVISGFGVYASLLRKPVPYLEFMRRRALRIYPPFLLVLCIYLTASLALPGDSKLPAGFLPALAHVAGNVALVPIAFGLTPIITVSWTLAYIVVYYAVIAAVVELTRMRTWPGTLRILVLGVVAIAWFGLSAGGSAYIRAGMFVVGMLVHEIQLKLPGRMSIRRLEAPALTICLALTAAGAWVLSPHSASGRPGAELAAFGLRTVLLAPALLAFGVVAFGAAGRVSRFFSNEFLQALGTMSYSYYLMHGLTLRVLAIGANRLGGPDLFWLGILPAYVLTLATAAVLFVAIERPVVILGARRPKSQAASAAANLRKAA